MAQGHASSEPAWKYNGVRVIPGSSLDLNTPQTPGMHREAAIDFARVGARKIWAGKVTVQPEAKTGAHHHGALDSVIYVLRGKARMRWGEHLEFVAEAGPVTSFLCRPTCRIKRSMRAMSRWNACWCEAAMRRSWSISISKPPKNWKRCAGSIRSTRPEPRAVRLWWGGGVNLRPYAWLAATPRVSARRKSPTVSPFPYR